MLLQQNYYKKLPLPEEQELSGSYEKENGRVFKSGNLQDIFLNNCRKNEDVVLVEMVDAMRAEGIIVGFDNQVIILGNKDKQQMIYKSNISFITPKKNVQYIYNENRRKPDTYK